MSQHIVVQEEKKFVFGWDQPLMSFYLQVHEDHRPEDETMVASFGASPDTQMYEVEDLVHTASKDCLSIIRCGWRSTGRRMMAGSYNHVVTEHGNLASPERVNGMLENGGDVYEAVEEMYGMIWWLASQPDNHVFMSISDRVENARQHYEDGLKLAKANKDKGQAHGS